MVDVLISEDDNVLRRVPINPSYIKPDGTITSYAFCKKRDNDGLTVDLESLTTPANTIQDKSRFRLRRINAGVIKNDINDGLDVVHDPIEGNFAHCLIMGNITGAKQKQMVMRSEEVIV